jgi:hypothetical protein
MRGGNPDSYAPRRVGQPLDWRKERSLPAGPESAIVGRRAASLGMTIVGRGLSHKVLKVGGSRPEGERKKSRAHPCSARMGLPPRKLKEKSQEPHLSASLNDGAPPHTTPPSAKRDSSLREEEEWPHRPRMSRTGFISRLRTDGMPIVGGGLGHPAFRQSGPYGGL